MSSPGGLRARKEKSPGVMEPAVENVLSLPVPSTPGTGPGIPRRVRVSADEESPAEDHELEVLAEVKMETYDEVEEEVITAKKTNGIGAGARKAEGAAKAGPSSGTAAFIPTRASARLAKKKAEKIAQTADVSSALVIPGKRKKQKSPPPRGQSPVAGPSRSVVKPVGKNVAVPGSSGGVKEPIGSEFELARKSRRQAALIPAVKVSLPFFHENVTEWNYSGKPVRTYNFNNDEEGLKSRHHLYHHLKIMAGGFLLKMDHVITKLDGEKFKCVYEVGEYVRTGYTQFHPNHFATIVMTTEADVASYFVFQIGNPGLAKKNHIGVSELRKACEIVFATPIMRCLQKDGRRFNEQKVREVDEIRQLMERATARAIASAADNARRLESGDDEE